MKTIIPLILVVFISNLTYSQSSNRFLDTLAKVNKILEGLPKSRRGNNYVKYHFQTEENGSVKLFCNYYDLKTNEKSNQLNVSVFKWQDIDPKAILIKAYNSKYLMLQMIVKGNEPKVNSSFFFNGEQVGNTLLDRVSIDSYDPKETGSDLDQLKKTIQYIVTTTQETSEFQFITDTGSIKSVIQNSKDGSIQIDLNKMNKNSEEYVFGTMEKSPIFQDSKSDKETETKVRSYLNKETKKYNYKGNGKVYVEFIIDKGGKAINPKVLKGVNDSLNNLSIKIIKEMPRWTPGIVGDQTVNTKFSTNIEFD